MYSIDEKDTVSPIEDIPQSSVGSPLPIVLSSEFATIVAFYLQDNAWDEKCSGRRRATGAIHETQHSPQVRPLIRKSLFRTAYNDRVLDN